MVRSLQYIPADNYYIRSANQIWLVMKRYFTFITALLLGLSVFNPASAQEPDKRHAAREQWHKDMEEFRARSAEDRAAEDAINNLASQQAIEAFHNGSFVFETETVSFHNGSTVFVNSTFNFISLNDSRAVVQISPSNFSAGANGVGGVTVDGMPTDITYNKDDKGKITFSMTVMGKDINATVVIDMVEGSNMATAIINPTFGPNRNIWMKGKVVPYYDSSVFEGQTR